MTSKYDVGLERRGANFRPLTPLHFLDRAADVYPDRTAVIYGESRYTWRMFAQRCRQLASALISAGIERGDTVSIFSLNTPAMLEAQFGIPLSGAVINCLNSRLDAPAVAFILAHSEARIVLVDRQLAPVAKEALRLMEAPPRVIDIDDPAGADFPLLGDTEYEAFIAAGDPSAELRWPEDEWDAIALNYTSGTTGDPKGVVYHHRGAYLNALGQIINGRMTGARPVYLWTLPLFHCNGWCFAWALAAVGGTQICMRKVSAEGMYEAISEHGVTLLCGAPIVLGFLADGAPSGWTRPAAPIRVLSGGASPPAPVFKRLAELGFEVVHLYGMTEMHGVTTLCEPQEAWDDLDIDERMKHVARQGVRAVLADEMIVGDPVTLQPVPRDGQTIGEVFMRGNIAMKGYLKNPRATEEAFAEDWYHTGDLAVIHDDGYIEVKDRSKDIIISGGENISSIEVEEALYSHPWVAGAAVVAVPDPKWGETPCAVVELKPGAPGGITEADIIRYCRERLAAYKCPRHVLFEPLVRTATGKLQKFRLRTHAAEQLAAKGRI
ncbi:AMP-binding protein [Xanthobacter aminoxidans]|uniref:AMP-binding protein n=1 Tax=Xanthobacter aminoxidans TaxID=186280 RepID=A0ABW6ZNB5_9HYPH